MRRVAPLLVILLGSVPVSAQQPPKEPRPPATPSAAAAQEPGSARAPGIVSQEVSLSRNAATLHVELADGRTLDVGLEDGAAELNGTRVGDAPRGSELDRSWRALLNQVIEADAAAVPGLLAGWSAQGNAPGEAIDRALEEAVGGMGASLRAPGEATPLSDSVIRLQERIAELERERLAAEDRSMAVEQSRDRWRPGPFHYIASGFSNLLSVIIVFIVLMALGIATVFLGGRKYIEAVADTARHNTMRSMLVGIAGTFLILPAFVLGIIALAISIVGILALPVWIIGFPIALFGALVLGYVAIAHGAGEALAERRLYGSEWFQRGNSYYFLLTGLTLLLGLFVAAAIVTMGGPWLKVISNLLTFFAIVVTWAAFTIGFGAVLISRGGKRPRGVATVSDADLFAEEAAI
jgi:hypothetical protein